MRWKEGMICRNPICSNEVPNKSYKHIKLGFCSNKCKIDNNNWHKDNCPVCGKELLVNLNSNRFGIPSKHYIIDCDKCGKTIFIDS